jgi:hypothetical protein
MIATKLARLGRYTKTCNGTFRLETHGVIWFAKYVPRRGEPLVSAEATPERALTGLEKLIADRETEGC